MGFGETFRALSDPARREILAILKNGRLSAGEIAAHFDMTAATISYHLKILKRADLLCERRERNFIFYELNTSVLEDVLLWIADLRGGGQAAGEEAAQGNSVEVPNGADHRIPADSGADQPNDTGRQTDRGQPDEQPCPPAGDNSKREG